MCHDKKRTCENYAKDSLYQIKTLVKMADNGSGPENGDTWLVIGKLAIVSE